jgi:hypothetical protein
MMYVNAVRAAKHLAHVAPTRGTTVVERYAEWHAIRWFSPVSLVTNLGTGMTLIQRVASQI